MDEQAAQEVRTLLVHLGTAMVATGQPINEVEDELAEVALALGHPDAQIAAGPTGVPAPAMCTNTAAANSPGPSTSSKCAAIPGQSAGRERSASTCSPRAGGRRLMPITRARS